MAFSKRQSRLMMLSSGIFVAALVFVLYLTLYQGLSGIFANNIIPDSSAQQPSVSEEEEEQQQQDSNLQDEKSADTIGNNQNTDNDNNTYLNFTGYDPSSIYQSLTISKIPTILYCEISLEETEDSPTLRSEIQLVSALDSKGISGQPVQWKLFPSGLSGEATTESDGTVKVSADAGDGLAGERYVIQATFTEGSIYHGASCEVIADTDNNNSGIDPVVQNNNSAPVANDDSASTREGRSVEIDILQNDSDQDGDTLTVLSFSSPSNGFVEYSESDNMVVYVADGNFEGQVTFNYTISDGNGGTDSATVTVTVTDKSSSNSKSRPSSECSDDILPDLAITSPSTGTLVEGPSNGILLIIEGTSSGATEECGIKNVQLMIENHENGEVIRWYRLATPTEDEPEEWNSWEYQFKIFSEGEYRVVARATDEESNRKWTSVLVTTQFNSDATQPVVTISSPQAGEQASSELEIKVSGTAFDSLSEIQVVEIRTGTTSYQVATPASADDWSSWSHTLTFTSPGVKQIVARATDESGNMEWDVIEITIPDQL